MMPLLAVLSIILGLESCMFMTPVVEGFVSNSNSNWNWNWNSPSSRRSKISSISSSRGGANNGMPDIITQEEEDISQRFMGVGR